MRVLIDSGRSDQRSITACRSELFGLSGCSTAAPGAALVSESAYSSGFTWVACGIIIRVSGVRVPPPLLAALVSTESLKKHWDDEEVVEILGVVSLFRYLNRWNDSMGTTLESPAVESGETLVGKDQWDQGKHV